MNLRTLLLTLIALACGLQLHAAPTVVVDMSSHFLTRGEQTLLEVIVQGGRQPDAAPQIPQVGTMRITPLNPEPQARFASGANRRSVDYVFQYVISGYDLGTVTIPSFDVRVDGQVVKSQPTSLEIFDDMSLQWFSSSVGETQVRYAAGFYSTKKTPYVGEKVPVEIKVYFPAEQRVEDWGIPDFERNGLSAWRFSPQAKIGSVTLLGRRFYAVSYPSTLSANREGKVSIGPASLRAQTVQLDPAGTGRAYYEPVNIKIPELEFDAKPLPPNPPEGFKNAIGRFTMEVGTEETKVLEGDPLAVDITVTGSGNLDTLEVPEPIDPTAWKIYGDTSQQRGDERRELYGILNFRQFLRPLKPVSAVPPFRLVYFDPDTAKYEILVSDNIPLQIIPSTRTAGAAAAPPQAAQIPVEEMTDILGIIEQPAGPLAAARSLPDWQVIPLAAYAVLMIMIVRRHILPRLKRNPVAITRHRSFREVENAPNQITDFYRAVGRFLESCQLTDKAGAAELLHKRDEVCFRQEAATTPVPGNERKAVLQTLKKIAFSCLLMAFLLAPGHARAAEADAQKAYAAQQYPEAARLWLESAPYSQLSADTLYNIGNAAYRMGSGGQAALYYRRALDRDDTHAEARQNLRFLERKFGSITARTTDYQYALTKISKENWWNLVLGSAWVILLAALVFPATARGASLRMWAIIALVTAPLIGVSGLFACHFYPDDAAFAQRSTQAVVTTETCTIHTDASRTSPAVIQAPAGTLCRVITRSGDWSYVGLVNEYRGWIHSRDITPLLPTGTPKPPEVRLKSAADDNT